MKPLDTIALGIESEWVFCKENEEWITTVSYYESLYKVCKKLGLKLNNNHAFRIALNSYVYVPMGLPVTERENCSVIPWILTLNIILLLERMII